MHYPFVLLSGTKNNVYLIIVVVQIHTVLGITKPENRFQKLMKNDITSAAI